MRTLGLALLTLAVLSSLATVVPGCKESEPLPSRVASAPPSVTSAPDPGGTSPLLSRWSGPYGGVPPFAKVKVAELAPALEAAMEEKRREIAVIADDAAAPTFENTIVALEDAGRALGAVRTIYEIWTGTMN